MLREHRDTASPEECLTALNKAAGLRVVRDCIRSAQSAMREHKRRENIKLICHWQNMLAILRDSERALLAIKED